MKRVRIVVAYDGTHYHGWQIQPGKVTIESKLNEALTSLLGEPVQVIGASRTESGVHARGNVAVFDTSHRMPADRICMALNQRLPEDIRVQSSEEVASDWHPRKCRCLKTYEYRILNRRIEMPMQRFYSHFCYFNLDLDKMRQAAGLLTGEHDFKSFCSVRTQVTDTVRTIYSIEVKRDEEDMIRIRVTGSGFLYNMVRIIAGTLVDIGTGRLSPDAFARALNGGRRLDLGATAPACGLELTSVEYDNDPGQAGILAHQNEM